MITDKFQVELHNSLSELQSNLENLQSAKSQIEGAKDAALRVISGMDQLSGTYNKHLKAVDEKIESFLSQAGKRIRTNLSEGTSEINNISGELLKLHQSAAKQTDVSVQGLLKEVGQIKSDYATQIADLNSKLNNFIVTSEQQFKATVDSGTQSLAKVAKDIAVLHDSGTEDLKNLVLKAVQNIDVIQNQYSVQIDEVDQRVNMMVETTDKKISEFLNKASSNQEQSVLDMVAKTNEGVKQAIVKMNDKAGEVSELYEKQNNVIESYMTRFTTVLDLVKSMEVRIAAINFPELFNQLEEKVDGTYANTDSIQILLNEFRNRIQEDLDAKGQKIEQLLLNQQKSVGRMKWLLISSGIIIITLLYMIFNLYF